MNHKPGTIIPRTGIYWCTVCKKPKSLAAGQPFPECQNMCGRGLWQPVEQPPKPDPSRS